MMIGGMIELTLLAVCSLMAWVALRFGWKRIGSDTANDYQLAATEPS